MAQGVRNSEITPDESNDIAREVADAKTSVNTKMAAGKPVEATKARTFKIRSEIVIMSIVSLLCLALIKIFASSSSNLKPALKEGTMVLQVIMDKIALAKYNGELNSPRYLAIMGEIFDVSKGAKYYGKGGGYEFFVGKDASRAFITGDFKGDLNDNVEDFDEDKCAGLVNWRNFYRKDYIYRGRLLGAFYDKNGQPTALLKKVEELAKKAKSHEEKQKELEASYTKCNVRWNEAEGGMVWCDDGLHPRKIISQVEGGGKPKAFCACFKSIGWSDIRQVYPDCRPEDTACRTSPPGLAPTPHKPTHSEL